MYYGYALYYKDKEGFELPVFHRNMPEEVETVLVSSYRPMVEQWLEEHKDYLEKLLYPKPITITTGSLWWKRTNSYTPRVEQMSPEEFQTKLRMWNTIFVKRVKLV